MVTPIARADDQPDQDVLDQLATIRAALPTWKPGAVADPVQRVRNDLYVAAAADVLELPSEPYVPRVVFDRIQQDVPKDDLIKVLYWIALHREGGDERALDDMTAVGLPGVPSDVEEVRGRAAWYAVKLLGRLMGEIKSQ